MAHVPIVKPPQPAHGDAEEEEAEVFTGSLSQSEFAAWFGNAIILASLGTIALFVDRRDFSRQIECVSILFISLALAITTWASYKFFLIRKHHHWTDLVLLAIVLAAIAAFIWFAFLV